MELSRGWRLLYIYSNESLPPFSPTPLIEFVKKSELENDCMTPQQQPRGEGANRAPRARTKARIAISHNMY